MGDFFAPKRKDVVDKLRRRIELYRHHHSTSANRFQIAGPAIYDQQKQDTLLLQRRWLDSKAKKAAKQSKANRDNNNTQSDHRNLVVSKLKRKIDSVGADASSSSANTNTTTSASETVFNFEDKDQPSAKNNKTNNNAGGGGGGSSAKKHNTGLPSLSVQIVQQISAHPQQDTSQTIHTNVTVSSRYGNSNSPNTGGASHSVHTSVQCKQEPSEDINNSRTSTSSTTPTTSSSTVNNTHIDPASVGDIGIGIDDVDELQNILDSIEKDEDIEPSLLKEINEFNEIYDKVQRDSESNESGNMYGPLACGSPGLSKGVFPNIGPGGHMGTMFDNNQNMNAAAMTNPNIPVPSAIPEPTGPAAETLKQMAAQHQRSPGYPMKGIDHFTADGLRNGGFPPNYSPLYRSPNSAPAFSYNQSTNHPMGDTSQMTPEMAAAMGYGGTKPLTHYPTEQGQQQHNPPSSLQQLQNQVQSHFKPSSAAPHQMQITQTQHMQVSHGAHSMQLSQTQQVQMQPSPQQISMSQQQNFNMGQQQMVNEQMKMQMMEKMRMEQQQQQQQQGRMPPQYMGRPPPEYKMHPNARPQGPYPNTTVSGGNQNPLQTMQNMVNQTTAYGAVKSEVASASTTGQASNGMMQSSQMTAMQQQTMSASMATNGPAHMGNLPQSNQGIRPGFHPQQHMQQPPAYSSVESSSRAQSSSTYTSAIMRNQRPPNVNVGPDGLNISQPRTHTEWPRSTMMPSGHVGMRPGMPPNGAAAHGMTQSTAMSAHMMQYQQHRPPHYGAGPNTGSMAAAAAAAATNMAQMQQQQQQVRPGMPNQMRAGPNAGMMPNGSQMMMQHQSMQVSQVSMHASNSNYNMGGPSPGTPNASTTGYNMGGPSPGPAIHGGAVNTQPNTAAQPTNFSGPPTSTSSQDEFLHFLDNPLGGQPMFDSIQNSTTDDFSLFEDILNGK